MWSSGEHCDLSRGSPEFHSPHAPKIFLNFCNDNYNELNRVPQSSKKSSHQPSPRIHKLSCPKLSLFLFVKMAATRPYLLCKMYKCEQWQFKYYQCSLTIARASGRAVKWAGWDASDLEIKARAIGVSVMSTIKIINSQISSKISTK